MAGAIAIYRPGASDSGGTGACTTPPTPLAPIPVSKYLIGGVPPVLEGDTMTPVPGTTPAGGVCTSPRQAVSTSTKVRFGGRRVCFPGDPLNPATGIVIGPSAASPKVFAV
tara:strand:- start:72 stop:404 length:333 start_codon:yes stop_codon:yes gene_type:complete